MCRENYHWSFDWRTPISSAKKPSLWRWQKNHHQLGCWHTKKKLQPAEIYHHKKLTKHSSRLTRICRPTVPPFLVSNRWNDSLNSPRILALTPQNLRWETTAISCPMIYFKAKEIVCVIRVYMYIYIYFLEESTNISIFVCRSYGKIHIHSCSFCKYTRLYTFTLSFKYLTCKSLTSSFKVICSILDI